MAAPRLTDKALKATIAAIKRHNGDRTKAGDELGLTFNGVAERIKIARQRWGKDAVPSYPHNLKRPGRVDPADIRDAVKAMEIERGSEAAAARRLGIPRQTLQTRLAAAELQPKLANGALTERPPVVRPVPKPGQIARYVLTSLQNNTYLHPCWPTLLNIAERLDAELMVGSFSYVQKAQGSEKRGTEKQERAQWWAPDVEPYICDELVQLAPGLMWNGHTQNWPTAVEPLSGMDNYNGRASGIFPHAKLQMKSIATIQEDPTKFQYTTGTVGLMNYIQRKAGQKAEFDHVFGGLLVEVDSEGNWWVRQLIADNKGVIYDLETIYRPDGAAEKHDGVEAVQWGDIHVAQLEQWMFDLCWGKDGMIDVLRPRQQFFHDLIDFESRSHHNLKDPHVAFKLWKHGRDSVSKEVFDVGEFLKKSQRPWCRSRVVPSNHNEHLGKWLKEGTVLRDPQNAIIFHDLNADWYRAIAANDNDFDPLRRAVEKINPAPGVEWLSRRRKCIILKARGGGLEMGLHGDKGPRGARGNIRNLAKLGRRVCIGHSHEAGIFNGAWQAGVTGRLDMEYASDSPSGWSHSHIIVHRNGKRQMVTIWNRQWRAQMTAPAKPAA